jgi:hypothetical protein
MKPNYYLYLILFISLLVNCFILYNRNTSTINKVEVTVKLDKKPIVKNFHFTNPTLIKEKTIEYRTVNEVLTRKDSDLIVMDYLKQRLYCDSLVNDTFKLKYNAVVEKNSLKDIKFNYSYRPLRIETKETILKKAFNIGGVISYNKQIDLGVMGGIEFKKYNFGIIYNPLTNLKGGSIYLTRRIFYN